MDALYHALAEFLKREHLSLSALAREMGISKTYLSLISHHKRIPAAPLLIRLAKRTGIPAETFIPPDSSDDTLSDSKQLAN